MFFRLEIDLTNDCLYRLNFGDLPTEYSTMIVTIGTVHSVWYIVVCHTVPLSMVTSVSLTLIMVLRLVTNCVYKQSW